MPRCRLPGGAGTTATWRKPVAAPAGGFCAGLWRWSWPRPGSQDAAARLGCAGSPNRGLSVASRTINVCTCWGIGGRPNEVAGQVQRRRIMRRCHPKQGLGRDHEDGPSGPGQEPAECREQARSWGWSRGRGRWRLVTASWWRRTRISTSWRPPTASRAPSTQGHGAAPGRRTTRPSAPTRRQHAMAHHSLRPHPRCS